MTIKTALRGTMGFGAACLLAGGVAWAEEAVSTGPATTPSNSDYRLRQPAPERSPAPITAPGSTAPDTRGGSLAPSDRTGSLGTGMSGRPMSDSQASTGSAQDNAAPVSVAGRVEKIDRADDTMEI